MTKIVVVIMGQDCKDHAEICIDSVQSADAIVFCDGGSENWFHDWLETKGFAFPNIQNDAPVGTRNIILRDFNQEDPENNGKQRNFYLDYLKAFYPGWMCLCLDADEIVDDLDKLRAWIDHGMNEDELWDVHMRHLVGNLRFEDAMVDKHYVPKRLFKVAQDLSYPLGEHVILQKKQGFHLPFKCNAITIWHLAYSPLFHVRSRMRKNLQHSNVHTRDFLDKWYRAHIFGRYPVREVQGKDLPPVLLKAFDIDPDEIYFADRGVETKHFVDAGHWRDFFGLTKENLVIEWGCGLGPRVLAMKTCGIQAKGIELSKYAVEHSYCPNDVVQGDITMPGAAGNAKLVIVYDVLEHLPYEKLFSVIGNLARMAQYILVSVPVLGDPNLENDPTHIIKQSKDWWKQQFLEQGCLEVVVPDHFLFRDQLLIFEVPTIKGVLFG